MTYDKPIVIQTQDPDTEQWTDALKLHARVNKTGGGTSLAAGADQYHVRLTFELRYVSALQRIAYGVQPFRVVYRGHTFRAIDYDDYLEQHLTVKLTGELYE